MNNVYILGGGVAGLTAAHELAERGFSVVVFEQHDICGGKARSMKNVAPVHFGHVAVQIEQHAAHPLRFKFVDAIVGTHASG